MKHDHKPAPPPPPPCKHEQIAFCEKCDAVECKGCGKEWTNNAGRSLLDDMARRIPPPSPYKPPTIFDGIESPSPWSPYRPSIVYGQEARRDHPSVSMWSLGVQTQRRHEHED